jgi:hypothetical protein
MGVDLRSKNAFVFPKIGLYLQHAFVAKSPVLVHNIQPTKCTSFLARYYHITLNVPTHYVFQSTMDHNQEKHGEIIIQFYAMLLDIPFLMMILCGLKHVGIPNVI